MWEVDIYFAIRRSFFKFFKKCSRCIKKDLLKSLFNTLLLICITFHSFFSLFIQVSKRFQLQFFLFFSSFSSFSFDLLQFFLMDLRKLLELLWVYTKDVNDDNYYICNYCHSRFSFIPGCSIAHLHRYMRRCVELKEELKHERNFSSILAFWNANGEEED